MKKLEDRLGELVIIEPARAIFEEVRQHFPEDKVLYELIARKIAEDSKTRVRLGTIKNSLVDEHRRKMKRSTALAIAGIYHQLLRDRHIDSDAFTINTRASGLAIIDGIRSMVPQIMDEYQFVTERELARWISEQYGINLTLILDIFEKRRAHEFTRQVEMIYTNMDNMIKAAQRGEPYKIPPKYLFLKLSAAEPAETLNAFIDRAIAQLLGAKLSKEARQSYKRKYLKHELSNLSQIKDLRELAEQVRKLYGFPEKDDFYRFSVGYADIKVPSHKGFIEQGRVTSVHRRIHVTALLLRSAKRKGLDISEYLPVYHSQYKDVLESVIERLKRRNIKPKDFGTALALTLSETPQEIEEHYLKGTQPMSAQQFKALATYR